MIVTQKIFFKELVSNDRVVIGDAVHPRHISHSRPSFLTRSATPDVFLNRLRILRKESELSEAPLKICPSESSDSFRRCDISIALIHFA